MKIIGKLILGVAFITLTTASKCSSGTKVVEQIVNKSSQFTKKNVNREAEEMARQLKKLSENPNVQRGAVYGGSRMLNNGTRSSAQTTTQPHWETCPGCQGDGKRMGEDGIIYVHQPCNGTGKIFVK
jgi:hypothetical protein